MKHTGAAMLLAAPLFLTACIGTQSDLNDSLAIGQGGTRQAAYEPATLKPTFGRVAPEAGAPASPSAGDQAATPAAPSLTGIERNNWDITIVSVPNDRAEHQPIYTRSLFENDAVARNRGLYPTALSVNQISDETSQDAQVLEAAEAPFAAAVDIILFIPRAVMNPPWQTVRTGFEPYRRAPAPRASVSPVLTQPRVSPATGKPGMVDPAAAPVQVPIGEYHPAAPPAGSTTEP